MIRALIVLVLLAAPVLAADAPEVHLEIDAPAECWLGEEVPVALRVLLDLKAFEAASVRLFPRAMDLQLKLVVPWAEGEPGPVPDGAETLSLVLNDAVVPLRRLADRDGRAVLEATWTLLPERAGSLELAAPEFTFAWATEFEDDFVSGRRPLDRREAAGAGEARAVNVRALPEDGRPAGFFGAVGRFIVLATVEPGAVAVGDEFTLTLRIEGAGNLERFDTPTISPDGFHVLGRIDDRASPTRTIRYDLSATRGGLEAFPSLPFHFFDPETGQYVTGATAPITLVVTGSAPEEAFAVDEEESGFPWPVVAGVVAALIAVLVLGVRMRRKPAGPEGPTPAELFREQAEIDLTKALTAYLATVLSCAPAAVISPDLAERLRAVGVERALAERAGTLVADLVGARYGGEADGDELRRGTELVDELELR
ncbi:MAG: BatD family protein [Planctomycetota bacterium]